MKRKDWKIKRLKKNTYGKFTKRRRIFLLRKLFLRKNLVFLKKNHVPHFYFYGFFLKFLLKFKKNYIFNLYSKKIKEIIYIHPDFFFNKKIFGLYNNFKNFLNFNKINYLFLNKNIKNNFDFKKGNNMVLFKNEHQFNNINSENYKQLFSLKNYHIFKENLLDNSFINYNINLFNLIEIYKSVVLLFINKLK